MSVNRHGLKVHPGDVLSNGAIVIAASESVSTAGTIEHCIVLAMLPKNYHQYVTWYLNTDERMAPYDGATYQGDYLATIDEASYAFNERIDSWSAAWDFRPNQTNLYTKEYREQDK